MHPLLNGEGSLRLYLLAWIPGTALLITFVIDPTLSSLPATLSVSVPLAAVHAFLSLAVWYPCRIAPIRSTPLARLVAMHGVGAIISTLLWIGVAAGIAFVATRYSSADLWEKFIRSLPVLFAAGAMLYMVAVSLHYLLSAFEQSRRDENRSLELKVLAREAELRALKAQIDPHFLFNSLNSVASLCGADPEGARRMSQLLADFLRESLRVGAEQTIPLSEEFALARRYLEVERVRFGSRLRVEHRLDRSIESVAVPPLILQPLVENAVRHGVGHLLEGGYIIIEARSLGDVVRLRVENACDPDRPRSQRKGIGMSNVAQRIETLYGRRGRFEAVDSETLYVTTVEIPITETGAASVVPPIRNSQQEARALP